MERRYELFAHSGVREIKRFNELVKEKQMGEKLPYLVVVIDELADLMMVAPNEVEESICRIAQKQEHAGFTYSLRRKDLLLMSLQALLKQTSQQELLSLFQAKWIQERSLIWQVLKSFSEKETCCS